VIEKLLAGAFASIVLVKVAAIFVVWAAIMVALL